MQRLQFQLQGLGGDKAEKVTQLWEVSCGPQALDLFNKGLRGAYRSCKVRRVRGRVDIQHY